jgi:hypothetical protein
MPPPPDIPDRSSGSNQVVSLLNRIANGLNLPQPQQQPGVSPSSPFGSQSFSPFPPQFNPIAPHSQASPSVYRG